MSTRANLTRWAALSSVAVALLLVSLKMFAAWRTGSVAMMGSLADSTLDFLASLVTLWAVHVSATPADEQHRFGHGKAEAIAALVQTGIITMSAGALLLRAVQRILDPHPVESPELGIGVSFLAIFATLGLVLFQRMVVRRTDSIAIKTDQLHYQSDLLLNSSVIAALALDALFKVPSIDAVMGGGIALYLAWGAIQAARAAIDMLMDKEWPAERRARVATLVTTQGDVRGIHELRTRTSGGDEFIQFHIWVDPDLSVQEGHRIADEVEFILAQEFPRADILIHVDPLGIAEKQQRDIDHKPLEPTLPQGSD